MTLKLNRNVEEWVLEDKKVLDLSFTFLKLEKTDMTWGLISIEVWELKYIL